MLHLLRRYWESDLGGLMNAWSMSGVWKMDGKNHGMHNKVFILES